MSVRVGDSLQAERSLDRPAELAERTLSSLIRGSVVVLDASGCVCAVYGADDARARDAVPSGRDAWVGRSVAEILGADGAARVEPHLRALFETGTSQRIPAPPAGLPREGWCRLALHPLGCGGERRAALVATPDPAEGAGLDPEREALPAVAGLDPIDAQHAATLNTVASALAHDMNNLLMATHSLSELFEEELPERSPLRGYSDEVAQATLKAALLARQLQAYTGRGGLPARRLDLDPLVREARPLLEAVLPKGLPLRIETAEEPLLVEADPSQLRQALVNLVTNAGEALEGERGEIRVRLGRAASREGGPADRVVLEVADDGVGMDAATRQRMVEPFFSTRAGSRGLGLAAVRSVVRRHGGEVVVESAPERGTRVRLLLPAVAPEPETREPSLARSESRNTPGGLVLLVDDEPVVRTVATAMLARSGFEVVLAEDGPSAIERLREHPEVACALVDLTMPGMDGRRTMAELRKLRPDLPLVLASGYDWSEQEKAENEGIRFLQKPFRLQALRETVREAIAERGA